MEQPDQLAEMSRRCAARRPARELRTVDAREGWQRKRVPDRNRRGGSLRQRDGEARRS